MIEKRKLIELIQDRIVGSGLFADVERLFPYEAVSELVGFAYSDFALSSSSFTEDLAREYTFTPSGKTVVLTPKPIGSAGILWVSNKGIMYPVSQGGMEEKMLSTVEPGAMKGCYLVNGNTLKFECDMTGDVEVLMIPAFTDLEDDDIIAVPGIENQLYGIIIQTLSMTMGRPPELYSDTKPDTGQPKNELVQ